MFRHTLGSPKCLFGPKPKGTLRQVLLYGVGVLGVGVKFGIWFGVAGLGVGVREQQLTQKE